MQTRDCCVDSSPTECTLRLEQRSCGWHWVLGSVTHTKGQCSLELYSHVCSDGPGVIVWSIRSAPGEKVLLSFVSGVMRDCGVGSVVDHS